MVESPFNDYELDRAVNTAVNKIEGQIDAEIRKGKLKLKKEFTIYIDTDEINYSDAVQSRVITDYRTVGWDEVRFKRESSPKNEEFLSVTIKKY